MYLEHSGENKVRNTVSLDEFTSSPEELNKINLNPLPHSTSTKAIFNAYLSMKFGCRNFRTKMQHLFEFLMKIHVLLFFASP